MREQGPTASLPGAERPASYPPDPGPGQVILPPRPNLGPEPWPEEGRGWTRPEIAAPIVLAAVVLVVVIAWRRRRGRRSASPVSPSVEPASPVEDPTLTLARRVRSLLESRLGEGAAAMTTEELSRRAELRDWLGDDRAGVLVAALRAADILKFGAEGRPGDTEVDVEAVARILDQPELPAGGQNAA